MFRKILIAAVATMISFSTVGGALATLPLNAEAPVA
jgi:hypothetical protein